MIEDCKSELERVKQFFTIFGKDVKRFDFAVDFTEHINRAVAIKLCGIALHAHVTFKPTDETYFDMMKQQEHNLKEVAIHTQVPAPIASLVKGAFQSGAAPAKKRRKTKQSA